MREALVMRRVWLRLVESGRHRPPFAALVPATTSCSSTGVHHGFGGTGSGADEEDWSCTSAVCTGAVNMMRWSVLMTVARQVTFSPITANTMSS